MAALQLDRLHAQERLSDRFMHNLLGSVHSGFSILRLCQPGLRGEDA